VEKHKNSKEFATRFDLWNGLRDLNFIIPRNFSNLSQKSGGRSGGAQMAANLAGAQKRGDDDEGAAGAFGENKGRRDGFVGLKSPDHLKKVCNMFRNSEHKHQPQKYMQNLRNSINYDNPEIFRGPVKTEIINR